jgi:hypothetical protein
MTKGSSGSLFDRVLDSIPVPVIVDEVRRELGASQALEVSSYFLSKLYFVYPFFIYV